MGNRGAHNESATSKPLHPIFFWMVEENDLDALAIFLDLMTL